MHSASTDTDQQRPPPTGFRAGFIAATLSLLLIATIGLTCGWLIALILLGCTTSFCAGLIASWK